ncbi:MAG: phosphoglycolate phosphatase [Acidobacteria bacterium]|nr:phosphoglycolate phosphatase [Acidobacteriota bacterium]
MKFKCLLFDLDGTLIDSRDDLADSVNLALAEMNLETLPAETIFDFIGEGVFNLVDRSLSASLKSAAPLELANRGVEVFRRFYAENALNKTRLYDGVRETLDGLNGFEKAVVTNKPRDFSLTILDGLEIAKYFRAVTGGDSFPERKPSAVPLLKTIESLGFTNDECLMIGDSRVDIETGKNARVATCGMIYGFRGRTELERAGADFLLESFSGLLSILH